MSGIDYSDPTLQYRPTVFTHIWYYIQFIKDAIQHGQDAPCRPVNAEDKKVEMNDRILKFAEENRIMFTSNSQKQIIDLD